jgi:hypothetical protein
MDHGTTHTVMQQQQKANTRTQQWGDKGGQHVPLWVTTICSVDPFWMHVYQYACSVMVGIA